MSKKLNITSITNELEESAFFPSKKRLVVSPPPQPLAEVKSIPETKKTLQTKIEEDKNHDTVVPRYHDTMIPTHHDTTVPLSDQDMVEVIRKAVKQVGKESATQRLTSEEVQNLKDVVYTYDRQGIFTTKNEVIRIATNFILLDFQKNGENSIVAKVIKKLNS